MYQLICNINTQADFEIVLSDFLARLKLLHVEIIHILNIGFMCEPLDHVLSLYRRDIGLHVPHVCTCILIPDPTGERVTSCSLR